MKLLISIDGGHGVTRYRPFVSGRSSYELLARNLPRLAAWCPDSVARMTFHPDALDFVTNVRQVLTLGAPSVALCPVVEADWNGHEAALEDAYQALADWFVGEARNGQLVPLETTRIVLRQLHYAAQGGDRPYRRAHWHCPACGRYGGPRDAGATASCIARENGLEPCRTRRFLQTDNAMFSWPH